MPASEEEIELVVIEALLLSAHGREHEAMQLLMSTGEENLSPAGLDLLARLAIQSGQITRSRMLWNRALQRDPSFSPAKTALEKLGTPWLFKSMLLRLGHLTGIACVIAFAAFGVLAVFSGMRNPPCSVAPRSGASFQWQEELSVLAISNCHIRTSSNAVSIVFEEGLFRARCLFADKALDNLAGVAQALQSVDQSVWFIIEGQSESFPVQPNRDFANNHELALARATAVANVLSSKYGISPARIFATSSDQQLFAETNGIQPLNRTVVIKLIQQAD